MPKYTEEEMKEWIDKASYEELLRKWRFAPSGDPFFHKEMGIYYSMAMAKKQKEVGYEGHVKASKKIGW